MNFPTVVKARSWAQFSLSLPGLFTPVPNRRLDAIVRNTELPLEDRFDALLMRTSLGNFSDFACDRITKSQAPATPETPIESTLLKPLGQNDFARILGVKKQRINEVVKLRQDQGLMVCREDLDNPRLLIPVLDPRPAAERKEAPSVSRPQWKDFSTWWDSIHPDLVEEAQRAQESAIPFQELARPFLERAEAIRLQKLADFKAAEKVPNSTDPPAETPPESPERGGQKVRDGADEKSRTGRTFSAPETHGHDMPRVRADLNSKQLREENHPSVGRSTYMEEPTDRPTGESGQDENPFKAKVREWLEASVSIPGFPLENPELEQIASTIQTEVHLEQFQEAAKRQKDPRGWKVYVKIARNCQKHQEKYAAAAADGTQTQEEENALSRIRREAREAKQNGR